MSKKEQKGLSKAVAEGFFDERSLIYLLLTTR